MIQSCTYKMPKNMEFETFKYNCDNLPIDMEEHSYMEEHYCNEFVYSAEIYQSTSVTEFNLVCERNHLKSLIGRIVEVCPSYPFFLVMNTRLWLLLTMK